MRVSVRSWLIRGVILAGVAAFAGLGWVANSWVSPERVREQVIAHLHEQFEGVEVHVGSARMRILGGIAVEDVTLRRQGASAEEPPFLAVPSAIIYHDKEQLNHGRLVIRKVELENPEIHLERLADGRWSLAEMLRPSPADQPIPTFIARGTTLVITDHSADPIPPLHLSNALFTLLNDPLPVLTFQVQATSQYGKLVLRARMNRMTRHVSSGLDLPEFPLGDVAPTVAERFAPALAPYVGKFTATAAVKADLNYTPGADPPLRHDIRVEVKDGRLEHADLPWPIEQIAVKVRSLDGRLTVEEATAKVGSARLQATLEVRDHGPDEPITAGPSADALAQLEGRLQRIEATVSGVALTDQLFTRLGDVGAAARRQFEPKGAIDLNYKFTREAAGWKREIEVRPKAVSARYEKFPYPVSDISGWVKRTITQSGREDTVVDLVGTAAGQRVTVKGRLHGHGPDPAINLRIAGTNIPIDDAIIAAFPDDYPDIIRKFRATGRADFVAEIVQKEGINLCENEFRVDIREGTLNYTAFPYHLDKVKGRVIVRVTASDAKRPVRPGDMSPPPDRDEIILDGFTGRHDGAAVWLHGSKRPIPGSRDRKLVLHVGGNACPVDSDLKTALSGMKLDPIWETFSPRGKLTFAADVEIIDRAAAPDQPDEEAPFDPVKDLRLTYNFYGPTVTPAFFPYELSNLSGWLEYRDGRIELAHFAGQHGESRVKLSAGEVRFYPDGVVWANLGGLNVKPLIADETLLGALPGKLRSAVEQLKLKGDAELSLKHMVVLTPPETPSRPPAPEPAPVGPVTTRTVYPSFVARGQSPPAALTAPQPWPPSPAAPTVPAAPNLLPSSPPQPVEPDPVVYWDGELTLAGASIDTGIPWEELYGRLGCRGRYEGTHLGLVRGNIWLDRAVIARQPVSNIKGQLRAAPQKSDPGRPGYYLPTDLQFTGLAGTLFHGAVGGEARVVLADPVRYEVWLTATDVQLEEVARRYNLGSDADLQGIAQAQLRVYNRLDPKTGAWAVEGAGKVDVPTGRMYNLPILLDLVKVLKLQAPDKTAFEEGHAVFRIVGDRVKVDQLDLIGKAVCLGGSGEVDTSGDYVRFEFYTLGSQILARLVNTPVGDLSAFLSKHLLLKIKMTRENGELKYRPEPVPVVTEPAKAIAERMRNRLGQLMGK